MISSSSLTEAVQAFHLEQRARGVSPHTVRAQKGDLEKLVAHAVGESWAGWDVTPRTLRRFALELGARGLDPASQARILSTARGFFRWLWDTGRSHQSSLGPQKSQASHRCRPFDGRRERLLLDLPAAVDFTSARCAACCSASGLRVSNWWDWIFRMCFRAADAARDEQGKQGTTVPFHPGLPRH